MISPLAYVDPAAKIGKNVTVQPFAYIEADVEIGDESIIMSIIQVSIHCSLSATKTISARM